MNSLRNKTGSILMMFFGTLLIIMFFISVQQSLSNSRELTVNRQELLDYAVLFLSDEELRIKGYQYDCSGYARAVYQKFGIELPASSIGQYVIFKEPDISILPGDLVFFKIRNQTISHVGIYVSDSTFIHSPGRNRNVCYEYLTAPYWKKYYAGYRNVITPITQNHQNND